MNELAAQEFNRGLAAACQACAANCCKKGLLFLPGEEYTRIEAWLREHSPAELEEFKERTTFYYGFNLYDQKDRCQFLDSENLCRLHTQGVKPSECFWWPIHIYANGDKLELRISTSCCEGYRIFRPDLPVVQFIEGQANAIGGQVIKAFRQIYQGSYDTTLIKELQQ